jgi:UDP-2,4-diacetamido-2,4,6-trideoxy-beta-L-altropyranose hydrolase
MTGFSGTTLVFRVDASLQIGSGHVMRCLTLAQALKAGGARCCFVSRTHEGHLLEQIAQHGFEVTALPMAAPGFVTAPGGPVHASWLDCTAKVDALQTLSAIENQRVDWLVADHYAIDATWESLVRPQVLRLMVIDDLADRIHRCDLLLDQNLGRRSGDYAAMVPPSCRVLAGPMYALLRPEFAALREYSLRRRSSPRLQRVLIAMGGVDRDDATGTVLAALRQGDLPTSCRLTVVMGANAPWLKQVSDLAARLPWPTEVLVSVPDLAQRMADADLSIGAAGGTAWERCCLGLPSLVIVLAENQRASAAALEAAGAAWLLGDIDTAAGKLPAALHRLADGAEVRKLADAAAAVTDGQGCARVLAEMVARAGV